MEHIKLALKKPYNGATHDAPVLPLALVSPNTSLSYEACIVCEASTMHHAPYTRKVFRIWLQECVPQLRLGHATERQGLLDAGCVGRKTTARESGSCMSCVSPHLFNPPAHSASDEHPTMRLGVQPATSSLLHRGPARLEGLEGVCRG